MEVIDTFVQTPFEIDMSEDVGIAPGNTFRCMRGGWENTEFVNNDGRLFTWSWNREVGRQGRGCLFCSVCVSECVCVCVCETALEERRKEWPLKSSVLRCKSVRGRRVAGKKRTGNPLPHRILHMLIQASLSLSLSLSHTHTHTLTLSPSFTHTHTHPHSLSLSSTAHNQFHK